MISLIDVMSTLDSQERPVGHGLKVLGDFQSLFAQRIQIVAGKEYVRKLGRGSVLPCQVHSGIHRDVSWKVLCNYLVSLMTARGSFLVYTVVPEPLLWGMALFKGRKKIIAVTYENWDLYVKHNLADKPLRTLRRALVKRGLSRLDGCIVTNTCYRPLVPYVRIPDYYITDEVEKHRKQGEKSGCVCVGEMRYGKDITGLAKVMGGTDIPLLISGRFQSRELYLRTKSMCTGNIRVEDRNLPYGVYLEYLSRYKYVVLPYDAEYYDGRTSGVLLEGVFLGAVPVAPSSLLDQNGIGGLGYKEIREIPELIRRYEAGEILVENSLEKYYMSRHREKVEGLMKELARRDNPE